MLWTVRLLAWAVRQRIRNDLASRRSVVTDAAPASRSAP